VVPFSKCEIVLEFSKRVCMEKCPIAIYGRCWNHNKRGEESEFLNYVLNCKYDTPVQKTDDNNLVIHPQKQQQQ
jgi:hypothetical protein